MDIAVKDGKLEIAECLIAAGASLYCRMHWDRRNVLHTAAHQGNEPMVRLLLTAGDRVTRILNVKDKQGCTALHLAVGQGNASIVKLLKDSCATLDIKNKAGQTAAKMALSLGHFEIFEILTGRAIATVATDPPKKSEPVSKSGRRDRKGKGPELFASPPKEEVKRVRFQNPSLPGPSTGYSTSLSKLK